MMKDIWLGIVSLKGLEKRKGLNKEVNKELMLVTWHPWIVAFQKMRKMKQN